MPFSNAGSSTGFSSAFAAGLGGVGFSSGFASVAGFSESLLIIQTS